MDAVTYPAKEVIEALLEYVEPVRVPHDTQPLATEYNVKWTPAIFIVDPDGDRHMNSIGFLPPEELIPWIILGGGMMHFGRDEMEDALRLFDLLVKNHPKGDKAAQAVYFSGVIKYKRYDQPEHLKKAYETLKTDYSDSIWAKKALPYRLL